MLRKKHLFNLIGTVDQSIRRKTDVTQTTLESFTFIKVAVNCRGDQNAHQLNLARTTPPHSLLRVKHIAVD